MLCISDVRFSSDTVVFTRHTRRVHYFSHYPASVANSHTIDVARLCGGANPRIYIHYYYTSCLVNVFFAGFCMHAYIFIIICFILPGLPARPYLQQYMCTYIYTPEPLAPKCGLLYYVPEALCAPRSQGIRSSCFPSFFLSFFLFLFDVHTGSGVYVYTYFIYIGVIYIIFPSKTGRKSPRKPGFLFKQRA